MVEAFYCRRKIITNNQITNLILDKKQNMPKIKDNINKDNLVLTI